MLRAGLSLCEFSVVGAFVDYGSNAYSNITMEHVFYFVLVFSLGCFFSDIWRAIFVFNR